jgi:D-alanyl-D-alanine dipeptidase
MDTLPAQGPDHIGIVSDHAGPSGLPLIINAWTDGYRTAQMDLLPFVPVTHRFRLPSAALPIPEAARGLLASLARAGLEVPAGSRQVLLVTTGRTRLPVGVLRRFALREGSWSRQGRPIPVSLGAAGLGCGRGLHARCEPAAPAKLEGDKRSPLGVFTLGTAFGWAPRPPKRVVWPYRPATDRDVWVDDPASPLYNTWQQLPATGPAPWRSAEALRRPEDDLYDLALVIEHNTRPVLPKAGSAIFLHIWDKPDGPTLGCTAMDEDDVLEVLRWLDPAAAPVIVQYVGALL